jgi:hypothetical protein
MVFSLFLFIDFYASFEKSYKFIEKCKLGQFRILENRSICWCDNMVGSSGKFMLFLIISFI